MEDLEAVETMRGSLVPVDIRTEDTYPYGLHHTHFNLISASFPF